MKLLILLLLFSCASGSIKKTEPERVLKPNADHSFYTSESSLEFVPIAIKIANCVTINKNFHQDIINNGEYEHYSGSNEDIIKNLISDKKVRVGSYYKWKSKAIAYRNPSTDKVYFNTYHTKKTSDNSKVKTLIHERLHVLGYNHKGNKRYKYKNLDSVPYKVSFLSEKYVERCK